MQYLEICLAKNIDKTSSIVNFLVNFLSGSVILTHFLDCSDVYINDRNIFFISAVRSIAMVLGVR